MSNLSAKTSLPVSAAEHPANLSEARLLKDCSERRERRSGPGGQHRNKVETAVVLMHEPTGLEAEANERRSQEQNRQVAVFRLRLRLAVNVRAIRQADAIPSELWRSRSRGGRISVNPEHADFPSLLAEALDVLAMSEFDVKLAAETLAVSGSQILKLLKLEPPAFERFNQERVARGLPRLM